MELRHLQFAVRGRTSQALLDRTLDPRHATNASEVRPPERRAELRSCDIYLDPGRRYPPGRPVRSRSLVVPTRAIDPVITSVAQPAVEDTPDCLADGILMRWMLRGEGRRRTSCVVMRRSRLLLTRFVSPGHPDSGMWTMPGGGMDWGESAEAAAHRELDEETGLSVNAGLRGLESSHVGSRRRSPPR